MKVAGDDGSPFQRAADRVSYAMGTPTNILIWVALVLGWLLLFALNIVSANATFLPAWFTGTAFNFPLNLVTTVAELYIGFLVGASANRSERKLEATLARLEAAERQIEEVDDRLVRLVTENTGLTKEARPTRRCSGISTPS